MFSSKPSISSHPTGQVIIQPDFSAVITLEMNEGVDVRKNMDLFGYVLICVNLHFPVGMLVSCNVISHP